MGGILKTKTCTKCKEEKPLSTAYFHKKASGKDGFSSWCKICKAVYAKNYREKNRAKILADKKRYRQENFELIKTQRKKHYEANKNKILEYSKQYAKRNAQKIRKYQKQWLKENKDRQREYFSEYYQNNKERIKENATKSIKKFRATEEGRVTEALRTRLYKAIKKIKDSIQVENTMDLVGCDWVTLKNHIEDQFQEGMTWENYGTNGWHIDHIEPICKFNLLEESERKKCFHYKNLQPLWARDNLQKNGRNMEEWLG